MRTFARDDPASRLPTRSPLVPQIDAHMIDWLRLAAGPLLLVALVVIFAVVRGVRVTGRDVTAEELEALRARVEQ